MESFPNKQNILQLVYEKGVFYCLRTELGHILELGDKYSKFAA